MLQVNGETLLIVDFDRRNFAETFFNSTREPLLTASYSPSGALIALTPVSPLPALNVTYTSAGALRSWHFDDLLVEFNRNDRTGNVEEKKFGAREVYRYIYRHGGQVNYIKLLQLTHSVC